MYPQGFQHMMRSSTMTLRILRKKGKPSWNIRKTLRGATTFALRNLALSRSKPTRATLPHLCE